MFEFDSNMTVEFTAVVFYAVTMPAANQLSWFSGTMKTIVMEFVYYRHYIISY